MTGREEVMRQALVEIVNASRDGGLSHMCNWMRGRASVALDDARALADKADWVFEEELDCHVPCCSMLVDDRRCGNGPLEGDALTAGDCGRHG